VRRQHQRSIGDLEGDKGRGKGVGAKDLWAGSRWRGASPDCLPFRTTTFVVALQECVAMARIPQKKIKNHLKKKKST